MCVRVINSQLVTDFLDNLKNYYYARDKALQSVMNYPHIEDQQINLAELERSFTYTLCRGVDELYSTYVGIYDQVSKNINKLLLPRDEAFKCKEKPHAN